MFLVALHSFCVGLGLIFIPLDLYGIFGFEGYAGDFFKIQAGVFHFVVCGAYIPVAIRPVEKRDLVLFSVFAKMMATAFLLMYTLLLECIWMVWASGLFDLMMGLAIIWFYRKIYMGPENS